MLAGGREGGEDYMRRLVNQLLAEMQGFADREGSIIVLGATNHPQLIDRAMLRPGRFDELVYVPLPDSDARRHLWRLQLSDRQRIGNHDYDLLAVRSAGYSGAEIANLSDKAAQAAMQRYKGGDSDALIEMTDLLKELKQNRPRTSRTDLDHLEAFATEMGDDSFNPGTAPPPVETADVTPATVFDPDILNRGWSLLEKYRSQLPQHAIDPLAGQLLCRAQQGVVTSDTEWNPARFEMAIIECIANPIAESAVDSTAEPDLPTQGHEIDGAGEAALELIEQHAAELTSEDLDGLRDQVLHNHQPDLTAISRQLDHLTEESRRARGEAEVTALLEDRKAFLTTQQLAEIDAELRSSSPNHKRLIRELNNKTFRYKAEQIVTDLCETMDLPRSMAGKLRRKAIRQIEKSGVVPTPKAVTTLLKTLKLQIEQEKRQPLADNLQAARVDDVNALILKQLPFDFSDVAGMNELKERLELGVQAQVNPAMRQQYEAVTGDPPASQAMLLYGTPGCGKTFLALAAAGEFAKEYGCSVIHVPTRAIDGLHYSKKCERIVEIFNLAKEHSPSIVIWDEFEALASPPEYSGRKYNATICAELKQQFEGVCKSGAMVLHIATSNYPWMLEPALVRHGRLGGVVHVQPPDGLIRKELFEVMLERGNLADDIDYDQLAQLSAGMSIAEIQKVAETAKFTIAQGVLRQNEQTELPTIGMDVLTKAISDNPPNEYRTWIAGARQTLAKPTFAAQRERYQNLLTEKENVR